MVTMLGQIFRRYVSNIVYEQRRRRRSGVQIRSYFVGEQQQYSEDYFQRFDRLNEWLDQQDIQAEIHVKAYYLGNRIDFARMANSDYFAGYPRTLSRDHAVIAMAPGERIPELTFKQQQQADKEEVIASLPLDKEYLVAYKYGSVVCFNMENTDRVLQVCREFTGDAVARREAEDLQISLVPTLERWVLLAQDKLYVKVFDSGNIRVISSVLGQSVAMEQHSSKVDSALEAFFHISKEMEQTGDFKMSRKDLFQLVAQNNILITDVITTIGLLDKSEVAWKSTRHYDVWDVLRNEFELEKRFETLDTKLKLIQENAKYFLDILQNRKSDSLEWTIIVLIFVEIIVSLYDIYTREVDQLVK